MSSNSRSAAKGKTNNDPVDELRRRSRRRLVGSIVLFFAAIIIVPALMEDKPSQTPSEIELVVPDRPSIEIPPTAKIESKPTLPQPVPGSPPVTSIQVPAVKPEGSSQISAKESATLAVEKKRQTKSDSPLDSSPEIKSSIKPVQEDPIAEFAASDVYWVQVAAVSDRQRADILSQELSGKGFTTKVESAPVGSGLIYRVRVGPILGSMKANETKIKLSKAGFSSGRVVR